MTMSESPQYWFKAKTYGWGWGLPATWQGWVAYAVFFLGVIGVGRAFPPQRAPVFFAIGLVALAALLFVVCLLKGEPPRWRWGGK